MIQNMNALRAKIFEVIYTLDSRDITDIEQAEKAIAEEAGELEKEEYEFLFSYIIGIVKDTPLLLSELSKYLKNWDIERISLMSKTAIKMGISDIIAANYTKDGSYIAIDVATTLAKKYSGIEDANFVNGVLANFYEKNRMD